MKSKNLVLARQLPDRAETVGDNAEAERQREILDVPRAQPAESPMN